MKESDLEGDAAPMPEDGDDGAGSKEERGPWVGSESDETEARAPGSSERGAAEVGEWDEQSRSAPEADEWDEQSPSAAEWVDADREDAEPDWEGESSLEHGVGGGTDGGTLDATGGSRRRRVTKVLYPLGMVLALAVGFAFGRTSVRQRVIFSGAMSGLEDRSFQGPADAPVTIVEYTDYDCPFCKRYHTQIYPALLQEYSGQVRYFVRHFPLQQLHPRAPNAARAAVCAEAQDRFWSYHDLLFLRGNAPDDDGLVAYADELGLDVERFSACMDDSETTGAVMADLQRGAAYGVRGTPAFFINGRVVFGAQPIEVFRRVMDAALEEAGAL